MTDRSIKIYTVRVQKCSKNTDLKTGYMPSRLSEGKGSIGSELGEDKGMKRRNLKK